MFLINDKKEIGDDSGCHGTSFEVNPKVWTVKQ